MWYLSFLFLVSCVPISCDVVSNWRAFLFWFLVYNMDWLCIAFDVSALYHAFFLYGGFLLLAFVLYLWPFVFAAGYCLARAIFIP